MQRLWEFGEQWVTDRPNTANLYRAWYDAAARKVRYASLYTTDLEDAKRQLAAYVLKHDAMPKLAPAGIELEAVLDRYYLQHGIDTAAARSAKAAIGMWKRHFGSGALVSDVTQESCKGMIARWRREGRSDGTIGRYLGVGRAAFSRAVKAEELTYAPSVPSVTSSAEYSHVATDAQMAAFLNAIERPHLALYCLIRIGTGCRDDAARDLGPAQVDFTRGVIALNPEGRAQTKKRRPTLKLVPTLAQALQEAEGADPYVSLHGDRQGGIRRVWSATRAKAELPDHFLPKIIRHTMATHLRTQGVPEWEAQGWLGHRAGSTSERYAKFRPEFMAASAAATEGYFTTLAKHVPAIAALQLRYSESRKT